VIDPLDASGWAGDLMKKKRPFDAPEAFRLTSERRRRQPGRVASSNVSVREEAFHERYGQCMEAPKASASPISAAGLGAERRTSAVAASKAARSVRGFRLHGDGKFLITA
jgi:hypothetical protein